MSVPRKAASQSCSQPCSFSWSKVPTIKLRMMRVMPAIRWASSLAVAMVKAGWSKNAVSNSPSFVHHRERALIFLWHRLGDTHRQPFFPADEPAKLQVVGQQPVRQAVAVASELLAAGSSSPFHFVQD